jgi:tRNA uridine 5-carboxymethylaminomethyl modification enzyme
MRYGKQLGLIEDEMIHSLDEKEQLITEAVREFATKTVSPNGINDYLERNSSGKLSQNEFIANIIKRNEVELKSLLQNDCFKENELAQRILQDSEAMNQIEIEIKYKGYIDRQTEQIESFVRNEEIRIPADFKYEKIKSLSTEAVEKLSRIKPNSIGQALRIAGVRPSDISAIMIYMRG